MLLTPLFAIRLILDSFFNPRTDQHDNPANIGQSILPKKSACPPPPPPPPPVKSVPLQQSSQDVLVESTTSAPQPKTLVEELQSVQLRKVPSFTGSHSMSSGYSGSSGLSEVIASTMSMKQRIVDQSDVKRACPPPPPPPPPVKSIPLQQYPQDVLVAGTTSAPQPKTLVEELQSVQLRKVPSSTGSHSMSSGYSGSSGLSEVIASAMSMQQLGVDQSYVKGACPPPPPPPPPVKSVPLQQSFQDVLVEGTTSAPQLKTLVEELQSVQLRKVPSSTGSHSMSSGYSGSSGLSEVIARAMSMRRCFIAQSDDEGDDDAVDSDWED